MITPHHPILEEIARQVGVPTKALFDACFQLFEGTEEVADFGEALSLSNAAVFSEEAIQRLPESIRDAVREMEASRATKRTEICNHIAQSLGRSLEAGDSEWRAEVEQLADAAIRTWEWGPELEHPSGPPTPLLLQKLLHEYCDMGATIHSFVHR